MNSSVRRTTLVLLTIGLVGGIVPSSRLQAQDPRLAALDSIRAMGLDSVTGLATAYFRPSDRERALQLRSMLEEYVDYWRPRLGVDTRMRVAVLTPEDWKKLTPLPYAFPNHFGPPAKLILAPADPPPPEGLDTLLVGDARDWLLLAHEGGHLLTWALLPPAMRDSLTVPPDQISGALRERYETLQSLPQWYWEFAASYLATGFLQAIHPAEAANWRRYLQALTAVPTPRFTHLDQWFGELMRAKASDGSPLFLSSEGGSNFGWYQGAVGLMCEHVLEHDADVVSHIRRMVSGEVSPTTPEIVAGLEATAPGMLAMLDSLRVGYDTETGSGD